MCDLTGSFIDRVENTVKKHNMLKTGDKIVVGLSGGADSVSLMVSLSMLKDKYELGIIGVHINHMIRGNEADRDEDFSKELCKKLGVEFVSYREDVPHYAKENRISEELAGRQIRYLRFNEVLKNKNANKIAVAHNKNDSVETVLIKLARGCSLNGLKGIQPVNGNIIRPLIDTDRADIEQFLKQSGFSYVTDSTNLSSDYTRNTVRNLIIPQFEKINKSFTNTVYSNLSGICEDDDFLETQAKKHNDIFSVNAKGDIQISIKHFIPLHNSMKRRVLLNAIETLSGTRLDIEKKHIDIILKNIDNTGADLDLAGGIKTHISSEYIILSNEQKSGITEQIVNINSATNHKIDFCGNSIILELTDYNNFIMQKDKNAVYINCDSCKSGLIKIRNRLDGDRFKPSGMSGTKKIKQFLCELKIPAPYRQDVPIIEIDGKIAAVVPYRTAEDFTVNKDTTKILRITTGGKYE